MGLSLSAPAVAGSDFATSVGSAQLTVQHVQRGLLLLRQNAWDVLYPAGVSFASGGTAPDRTRVRLPLLLLRLSATAPLPPKCSTTQKRCSGLAHQPPLVRVML